MTDREEWGPWIEHDGKGCPVKGMFVETETADGMIFRHIAHGLRRGGYGPVIDCWDWEDCFRNGAFDLMLIRYRIRKPRGLTMLQDLIADLPETPKVKA